MYGRKNFWARGNRLGLFFVLLFIVCFIWYFVRGAENDLQLGLLKLGFFGYSGMNFTSFILGAIQIYIWGYVFTVLWQIASCCGMKKGEVEEEIIVEEKIGQI